MRTGVTVLVDMDGVLADFDSQVLHTMTQRHPEIPIRSVRENFQISDDYPAHFKIVSAISDAKGFFELLQPVENAIDGWRRLISLGYHPRVCSSPMKANPGSADEKLRWLAKHFAPVVGNSIVDEALITNDKYLADGRVLIDDRPQIKNYERAKWTHLIFDQPFNRHVQGPRLHGWLDEGLPTILRRLTS